MNRVLFILCSAGIFTLGLLKNVNAQTNMFLSNPEALEVLTGNYNPNQYLPDTYIVHPDSVKMDLINRLEPQVFIELLTTLETFYNRNSGSDTSSLFTGIGACRSWILANFEMSSRENQNRLITGYLEFDAEICGCTHHKNPFAILPGRDTSLHDIIVIEGHFDTRNEDRCDTQGYTPGIDDNGSGTVLVMELAHLLSSYVFDRTILFTTPTGEDQGLWGATAWANYLKARNISIRAVLNNDIVGGIYCGKTSAEPSCPYYGHVDSTHVRIFSYSPNNSGFSSSPHKQLARYTKYIQEEIINPFVEVPMTVNIMLGEDRQGRGGDHTPFRRQGYTAIRIISANEHGNGSGAQPDRIHTTRDLLGMDVDGDGILDSLFVNPGYLSRNMLMNAVVASHLANSAGIFEVDYEPRPGGVRILLPELDEEIDEILIGVRYYDNRNLAFDEVIHAEPSTSIDVDLKSGDRNFISVSVVKNGAISLFSNENQINLTSYKLNPYPEGLEIHQNFPNPWNESTTIFLYASDNAIDRNSVLQVRDLLGRVVIQRELNLNPGENEVVIKESGLAPGLYQYGVIGSGDVIQPLMMVKR